MSVIRVNKTADYTVMSNHHLKNRKLSLKAKGLMSQMLSLPDTWDYSIAGLSAINVESESAIKTALTELKKNGYLVVTKLTPDMTDSGRIEYIYDLYEEPHKQEGEKQGTEIQPLEIQPLEIQPIENHGQLITNNKTTKESNTKGLSTKYRDILMSVKVIADSEELLEAFSGFIEMRKSIRKPLTEKALKLSINDAYKFAKGDVKQMIAIVNQSVKYGWQGIFPLKEVSQDKPSAKSTSEILEDMLREAQMDE